MGKIRNWLIHKLGGVPREECDRMIRQWSGGRVSPLRPRMLKAAYSYYVHQDTPEVRRSQEMMAAETLAKKIALEMLDAGMIHLHKQLDPIQDSEIPRYRMKATVWALDDTQMPCYGGDGL